MKAAVSALVLLASMAFAVPTSFTTTQEDATTELFPNYLVPAKQNTPNEAYNTQFTARVNWTSAAAGDESITFVGFDVPNNGLTNCAIKFTVAPKTTDGFQWTLSGAGAMSLYLLNNPVVPGTTTWNSRPARLSNTPSFTIVEPLAGGDATLTGASIPCKNGQRMDFEASVTHSAGASGFFFFELTSPKTGWTLEMS